MNSLYAFNLRALSFEAQIGNQAIGKYTMT